MDIVQFQIIRSPNKAADRPRLQGNYLIPNLQSLHEQNGGISRDDLSSLVAKLGSLSADPLEDASRRNPDTPAQWVFWTLGKLDEFLSHHSDRADAAKWRPVLDMAKAAYARNIPNVTWQAAVSQALAVLEDWICAAVALGNLELATRRTRLWSILELIERDPLETETADQTSALLATAVPFLPAVIETFLTEQSIRLVRDASVSDLYVVRQEWRGYVTSDIAKIVNVLPGSEHETSLRRTDETEKTLLNESSTQTTGEIETRTEDRSELSRETETQLRAEINGYIRTDMQQDWGTGSINVSGGAEGRLSLDQTERHAARTARSATTRATTKIDNLVRESRMRRDLTKTELFSRDALNNTGQQPVRGVYRWLDRIDRYQIWRYPDRLQLEFQIPEPAEFLRWRSREREKTDQVGKPPEWLLRKEDIDVTADLIALARQYRATGLPRLPAEKITVSDAIKAQPDGLPTDKSLTSKIPTALAEVELLVPDGYAATSLEYGGYAIPAWGNWNTEKADGTLEVERIGWHGSVVSVSVGGQTEWFSNHSNLGDPILSNVVRAFGMEGGNWPRFGKAVTVIGQISNSAPMSKSFTPPAVGKVKIALQGAGVSSVSLSIAMVCDRTNQALGRWQQEVYDALFDAWSQWKREWDNQQSREAETRMLMGEGSAEKLRDLVRNEIKRQVITWLLEEPNFRGRPALGGEHLPSNASAPAPPPPPANGGVATTPPKRDPKFWHNIDIDQAVTDAATIQFMEQAFEWGNMQFVLYPYFWADSSRWQTLSELSHSNPDFERFLQSGSARVVVSARPAFKTAVLHWLVYRKPYLGKPLPLPGNDLFVSLAQEVRDLTLPPPDGVPGPSWEARVGTDLLWLEMPAQPPRNARTELGLEPNGPDPAISLDPT